MNTKIIVATAAIAGLLAAGSARATPTTFFGQDQNPAASTTFSDTARANFLSHLAAGIGTEDFESFTSGTTPPLTISFPGSTGGITATLSGDGIVTASTNSGAFATSGSNYYNTNTNGQFSLDFSSPVSAFGFYGTDISDIDELLQLMLTDTAGNVTTLNVTNSTNNNSGNELFFGFIDTGVSYNSISFVHPSGTGDLFGFDDMTIGDLGQVIDPPASVPEPGALAMFGLGLLCLLGLQRRRRA